MPPIYNNGLCWKEKWLNVECFWTEMYHLKISPIENRKAN